MVQPGVLLSTKKSDNDVIVSVRLFIHWLVCTQDNSKGCGQTGTKLSGNLEIVKFWIPRRAFVSRWFIYWWWRCSGDTKLNIVTCQAEWIIFNVSNPLQPKGVGPRPPNFYTSTPTVVVAIATIFDKVTYYDQSVNFHQHRTATFDLITCRSKTISMHGTFTPIGAVPHNSKFFTCKICV